MSNRQLTINGLLATGAAEVIPSPSKVYRTFTDPTFLYAFYFVGKSGALRYGQFSKTSRSLTDTPRHKAFREIGNPALRWESTEQARAAYERILAGRPLPAVSGYVDTGAE